MGEDPLRHRHLNAATRLLRTARAEKLPPRQRLLTCPVFLTGPEFLPCPVFLTGPEFLPELREHRGRTLTLITAAQVAGHSRVAQMNEQVLTNLDRMIEGVETPNSATALQPRAEVSDAI